MKDSIVDQQDWDKGYEKTRLEPSAKDDPVRRWLESHIPPGRGTALELGCFPGRYLVVLAMLGYEVHGIDLTPRIETELKGWLLANGYRAGEFIRADVTNHVFEKKYDVVCSFGLIEHFTGWKELLKRHAGLVKPGGFLAVSTPNFRGIVQQALHRSLDGQNLSLHILDAMDPKQWAEVIQPLGFEIVSAGHFGGFDFWVGAEDRNLMQKAVIRLIRYSCPVLGRLLPSRVSAYSAYCGLIARRL